MKKVKRNKAEFGTLTNDYNIMLEPNIISGGIAIPIDYNTYLLKGRTHKKGGIKMGDIGTKSKKVKLEAEDNEIEQINPEEIRIFSAQKFLGGKSPAELVLSGVNPDKVFAAQETYKKINGINDDGTKKAENGLQQEIVLPNDKTNVNVSKYLIPPMEFNKTVTTEDNTYANANWHDWWYSNRKDLLKKNNLEFYDGDKLLTFCTH